MNSRDDPMAGDQEMIIATRVLKLRRPEGDVDLPVHIFAPKKKGEEWSGRVEIGWPGTPQPIAVNGCIDAVHVIETSMRLIGAVLYASMAHLSGNLVWQQPGNGYGFPVLEDMREMLQGEDKRRF
jgi:hypothetical protein